MTKKYLMFGLLAAGAVFVALWVWRKLNPAPPDVGDTYRNETDKSVIEVGMPSIRPAKPLSEKKVWDDISKFVDSFPRQDR